MGWLIFLLCPLMMFFMMRHHKEEKGGEHSHETGSDQSS